MCVLYISYWVFPAHVAMLSRLPRRSQCCATWTRWAVRPTARWWGPSSPAWRSLRWRASSSTSATPGEGWDTSHTHVYVQRELYSYMYMNRVSFRIFVEGGKHVNYRVRRGKDYSNPSNVLDMIVLIKWGGGLGACFPRKILNFQPLRLFLVASETKLSEVSTGSSLLNNDYTLSLWWTHLQPPSTSTLA